MSKIDNFLIDQIFEPFSHFFQKITGKDCFWLAAVFFCITFVAVEIKNILDKDLFWAIAHAMNFFWLYLVTRDLSPQIRSRVSRGLKNEIRNHSTLAFLRKIMIFFCLVHLLLGMMMPLYLTFIWGVVIHSFTYALYFASCTPLPPQKSSIKAFLEGLATFFSPTPQYAT
jgi:hypothetical protein